MTSKMIAPSAIVKNSNEAVVLPSAVL